MLLAMCEGVSWKYCEIVIPGTISVVGTGTEDRFGTEPFIDPHPTSAEVLDDAVVGDRVS